MPPYPDPAHAMVIDGTTKILGVLGWPVEHSLSPVLQNAALAAMVMHACYLPLPCRPEGLGEAIAGLRALGFVGANVTIPHKQAVISCLDDLSPESRFTRSVNTLYWEGERLKGTTTDATGALLNLEASGVSLSGKRVALLGTGGAARALGFMLARGTCLGLTGENLSFTVPELTILGRDPAKAARLAAEIARATRSSTGLHYARLADFTTRGRDAELVINCTSVGMEPHAEQCPIQSDDLRREQIVYDIVYRPRETVLLREARRRGCVTVEGIGMLVYQGAASFRHWFGKLPDASVMFGALQRYGY